jgi:hypothetical protein
MHKITMRIFTALLGLFVFSCVLNAQTTVNWHLDKADTTFVSQVSGTGYTASNQSNSNLSLISWTGFGSDGVQNAERNKGSFETATRSLPLAFDATVYLEYAITATAGYDLTVSQIQMYLAGGGISSVYAQIKYSTDNFVTSTTLDDGSAALIANTTSAITNKTFSTLNIPVLSGSTLKIRVYPKNTGGVSTTKYLISNNVSVTFTPTARLVNGLPSTSIPGVTFDGRMIHNNGKLDLQVYDATGRKITKSTENIDMSIHANGVYIVKSIHGTLKIDLNK